MRLLVVGLVIFGVLGAGWYWWSNNQQSDQEAVPPLETTESTVPITGTQWYWVSFANPVESLTVPSPASYTLLLNDDETWSAQVDCNRASGSYTMTPEGAMTLEPGPMTLMQCPEGSLSDQYIAYLGRVSSYFVQDGALFLEMPMDSGTLRFEAQVPTGGASQIGTDPLNATYTIDGKPVTMTEGKNQESIPNSATEIVTTVWGEPVDTDLAGNPAGYAAVVLNREPGGSASYFYIAACVDRAGGCVGTNAEFLGDRIAMQTVGIEEGVIVVNFADRAEGEPMTADPSVGTTKRFVVEGTTLLPVGE